MTLGQCCEIVIRPVCGRRSFIHSIISVNDFHIISFVIVTEHSISSVISFKTVAAVLLRCIRKYGILIKVFLLFQALTLAGGNGLLCQFFDGIYVKRKTIIIPVIHCQYYIIITSFHNILRSNIQNDRMDIVSKPV